MNLNEWRDHAQADLTLPSGLRCTVRRVSLFDLVRRGHLSPTLINALLALSPRWNDSRRIEPGDLKILGDVMAVFLPAVFVDPLVAEASDQDHLGIDELPLTDCLWLLNWSSSLDRASETPAESRLCDLTAPFSRN